MSIDAPVGVEAQAVLDSFDRLDEPAKRDVLARLLIRVRDMEWPDVDDETLDQIAAESFAIYDREEAELEAANGEAD